MLANSPRRVTIDLTSAAVAELDRVKGVTGMTTADIFRHAFTLFRIYVDERAKGHDVILADPDSPEVQTRLVLPVEIKRK